MDQFSLWMLHFEQLSSLSFVSKRRMFKQLVKLASVRYPVTMVRSLSGGDKTVSKTVMKKPMVIAPGDSGQITQHLPVQISFEDFLQADTNRDGRVTAAEWDNYVRSKHFEQEDPLLRGVTVHIPVSPTLLREIVESSGFGVSINGLHYTMSLKPEGKTIDLIKKAQTELQQLNAAIEGMEAKKAPLDATAAIHVRRVMSGLLGYLLLQAGVVAKLTFYSRFGWDIMEPITYFITFGISLVGLLFFTRNRLEFSYPALAALVARRKAIKLYKKHNFDEEAYLALKRDRDRVRQQLDAMVPAQRIFDLENKLG